jgi:hypothetical protein
MTALIIILAILIILLGLFFSPVKIDFDFTGGKSDITLKYLFLKKQLSSGDKKEESADRKSVPEKAKKQKTNKKTKPKKSKAEKPEAYAGKEKKAENGQKTGKKSFLPDKPGDQIDFILDLVKAGGKAMRSSLKNIYITKIFIDFKISQLDAYQCALQYGKVNMLLYNLLRLGNSFFTMKKKSINVRCVFNEKESRYDFSFQVKIRPSTALRTGIVFIFAFLANTKSRKKSEQPENQNSCAA